MQVLWKKIKISPEVKYISLHHNSQTLQQMWESMQPQSLQDQTES